MSRIGKQPITIPDGVTVAIDGRMIRVKGIRGELEAILHEAVIANLDSGILTVSVSNPENRNERALWGLSRSLVANMVRGVTEGFKKQLELVGVGYKVSVVGQKITLNVGFSHPIEMNLPEGIQAAVEKNILTIEGNDKQLVGDVAAHIRRLRIPEPYKGKGIKYVDEIIRRKAGKTVKAAA